MERYDKILKDLIQIESVNDNEEEVAKYIEGLFEGEDRVTTEIIESYPGRSNIIVKLKGDSEGKIFAYSGHLDVVAPGDGWDYDPFGAEIEDGKMYGRGTADMKAGVAISLYAILDLIEEGTSFPGEIWFLGTVGEEVGMQGAKDLVEGGHLDEVDAILLPEPTNQGDGKVWAVFASKGAIQYTITAKGKAAHSSMPELGINALTTVAAYIEKVQAQFDEVTNDPNLSNEHLGNTLNVFSMIEGGVQINSVPDHVQLRGAIRTVPEFSSEEAIKILTDAIEENNQDENNAKLELELTQVLDPAETSQDSDLINSIVDVTEDWEVSVEALQGTCEMSRYGHISDDIQMAVYGPGNTSQAHVVNEYVEMDVYYAMIKNFKDIALDFLNK